MNYLIKVLTIYSTSIYNHNYINSTEILFNGNNNSSKIHVFAKHYQPFMMENSLRRFSHGLEYYLIRTIANELQMDIEFLNGTSQKADVITSGLIPKFEPFSHDFEPSLPYYQDDLMWCVRKSGHWPVWLNFFRMAPPGQWAFLIMGIVYFFGTILYLLIQFDLKYEQRNNRDWHYFILLIMIPICTGVNQRFNPQHWMLRFIYFGSLLTAMYFQMLIGVFFYNYLKEEFPLHQIATVNEIIKKDFHLAGSHDVLNAIRLSPQYPHKMVDSFGVCEPFEDCLKHLKHADGEKLAVGGSRLHIFNSPEYSTSNIYCFQRRHAIGTYQGFLHIRKTFGLRSKVNEVIQKLFNGGIFVKWMWDNDRKPKYEPVDEPPITMHFEHLRFGLMILCLPGLIFTAATFSAELIVFRKIKENVNSRFWIFLRKVLDGHRHFWKDTPESLQKKKQMERRSR